MKYRVPFEQIEKEENLEAKEEILQQIKKMLNVYSVAEVQKICDGQGLTMSGEMLNRGKKPLHYNREISFNYLAELELLCQIEILTCDEYSEEEKKQAIARIEANELVESAEIKELEKDTAKIQLKSGQMLKFKNYSSLPMMKDEPRIRTSNRAGKCHKDALRFLQKFSSPTFLKMAKVYQASNEFGFYHSWLEHIVGQETLVLDYTKNLIMNQQGYYFLYKPQIITTIDSKAIQPELKKLQKFGVHFENGVDYLYYHDDVLAQIKQMEEVEER